jgi:adenylosuccinate lyase
VESGLTRDQAYRLVQKHALEAWKGGTDLKERLLGDADALQYISKREIESAFQEGRGLEHVEHSYKEVFRRYPL